MRAAFIGFGGLGKQVQALLQAQHAFEQMWYFDDNAVEASLADAVPFASYGDHRYQDLDFYVCLGYHHLAAKIRIIGELLDAGRRVPAYSAPSAYISPSATLGAGTIVYPMSTVDLAVLLGRGVLINSSVTISHDCRVGDGCYLAPGVVLSGNVALGSRTFVGAGSVIANDITVGSDAIIGVGTVVTRDIPSGSSVIGNPMRILSKPLRLI